MDNDEFYDITFGDHPNYKTVVDEEIVGNSRWSHYMEMVIEEEKTGKFFLLNWEVGATEYQDPEPNFEMVEVFPKQVMTTVYTTEKD